MCVVGLHSGLACKHAIANFVTISDSQPELWEVEGVSLKTISIINSPPQLKQIELGSFHPDVFLWSLMKVQLVCKTPMNV